MCLNLGESKIIVSGWIDIDELQSHLTLPSIAGSASRNHSYHSLPSPSSPSLSQLSTFPDDSLSQLDDCDDHTRRVPDLPIAEPISPLVDRKKRPTRNRHPTRVVNTSALPAKSNARKADPIKAMLRERKTEARSGGGIDALNLAEGYSHHTLLSDFNIDEVDEPVDTTAPTRSNSMDQNPAHVALTSLQTDDTCADLAANSVEDEVQQDERERLLGAKEGEAVGKILDADRSIGQTTTHSVPGVSVFVDDHEGTVNVERDAEACPTWKLVKDKPVTLEMLSEAIEQQGAQARSLFVLSVNQPYFRHCVHAGCIRDTDFRRHGCSRGGSMALRARYMSY
jgi:hypothetical protein